MPQPAATPLAQSPHPSLDALKAQLAALPPQERQKALAAFSELVRKRLATQPGGT